MENSRLELYASLSQGLENIKKGDTRPLSNALFDIKKRRRQMDGKKEIMPNNRSDDEKEKPLRFS